MKQQGLTEVQITQSLQEQGVSPREINEAIDQSNVKAAVYQESQQTPESQLPQNQEMQPSVMQPSPDEQYSMNQQQAALPAPSEPGYMPAGPQPQTQEVGSMPPQPMVTGAEYSQYPEQYGDYQGQYPQYPQEYQYPAETDTETITEVAQQIVDEKLEKIKKQLQSLEKFKTEVKGRILDLDSRLTRIEKSIDLLQTSVLGKIGEYWKNVSDLKKEMQATQDSFSKIINPLADEMDKIRGIAGEGKTPTAKRKGMTKTEKKRGRPRAKGKKAEDGFENYLR